MENIRNKLKENYESNQNRLNQDKLIKDKKDNISCNQLIAFLNDNIRKESITNHVLKQSYYTRCDEFSNFTKQYFNASFEIKDDYINAVKAQYNPKTLKVDISLYSYDDRDFNISI